LQKELDDQARRRTVLSDLSKVEKSKRSPAVASLSLLNNGKNPIWEDWLKKIKDKLTINAD